MSGVKVTLWYRCQCHKIKGYITMRWSTLRVEIHLWLWQHRHVIACSHIYLSTSPMTRWQVPFAEDQNMVKCPRKSQQVSLEFRWRLVFPQLPDYVCTSGFRTNNYIYLTLTYRRQFITLLLSKGKQGSEKHQTVVERIFLFLFILLDEDIKSVGSKFHSFQYWISDFVSNVVV